MAATHIPRKDSEGRLWCLGRAAWVELAGLRSRSATMLRCPECGEENPSRYKLCEGCGAYARNRTPTIFLEDTRSSVGPPKGLSQSMGTVGTLMIKCGECGRWTGASACSRCTHCHLPHQKDEQARLQALLFDAVWSTCRHGYRGSCGSGSAQACLPQMCRGERRGVCLLQGVWRAPSFRKHAKLPAPRRPERRRRVHYDHLW